MLKQAGASASLIQKIGERLEALNHAIASDTRNLGPGYCIGHSYFCPLGAQTTLDENWQVESFDDEAEGFLYEVANRNEMS